ncbi:MAG: GAF domain-containing protein [Candidatus Manganitrophus sp.]|nr:GAF domain-containing protein [Candidatus Manganitrophus sp.]
MLDIPGDQNHREGRVDPGAGRPGRGGIGQRRLAFLSEASTILSSSLDYPTTLASVARLAVPLLSDWCVIHMLGPDGVLSQLATAHTDPARIEIACSLSERCPIGMNLSSGLDRALMTGRSELYPQVTDAMLKAVAQDEVHLHALREMGFKSAMVIPIRARDKILGTITFISAESGRRFGQADLTFAEALTHRASLAVDNALLYEAERTARAEAEAAQQRLTFLSEASMVLSASLDYETTLKRRSPASLFPGSPTAASSIFWKRMDRFAGWPSPTSIKHGRRRLARSGGDTRTT